MLLISAPTPLLNIEFINKSLQENQVSSGASITTKHHYSIVAALHLI